jgi:hypothetical protein
MPYSTNVENIWDALGSYWMNFEDRALIIKYWQTLYYVMSGMYKKGIDLYDSQGFQNMPPYVEDKNQVYDIIYSVNSPEYSGLINTISGTGYQEFYITPGTFSIPTLTYYYYSTSGTLSSLQTMSEGVNYTIQDMERIRFLGSPPFIPNYNQTHFNGNKLSAATTQRVNPALWGVLPKLVGLSDSDIRNNTYPAFKVSGSQEENLTHFKNLVWGLQNGLRAKPTIANIEHLYGLARGLPFAYESGIYNGVSISNNTYPYTLGNIVLSGYTYLTSGSYVSKFQVLLSGINVYDYVNNYSAISGYCSQDAEKYGLVVISEDYVLPSGVPPLSYNVAALSGLLSNYLPADLKFITIS